jgi:hypothetical protein
MLFKTVLRLMTAFTGHNMKKSTIENSCTGAVLIKFGFQRCNDIQNKKFPVTTVHSRQRLDFWHDYDMYLLGHPT